MAKHTRDDTFFSKSNSSSDYWAGFLAADGSLSISNMGIRIGLARRDRTHIEKFVRATKSTSPVRDITTSNGYPASQVDMYGVRQWHYDLNERYNVTPRKSLSLKPPPLEDEESIKHFIRGYMDGDGSISYSGSGKNNHWVVSFLGTEEVLRWTKSRFQYYLAGKIGDPSVSPDRNTHQIIFGCWQVRAILEWLYSSSTPDIRLDRKYDKALDVFDFYPKEKKQYASKYKGVNYFRRTGKWTAEIKHQRQRYHLGYFDTEEEAAFSYNKKALELGLPARCYFVDCDQCSKSTSPKISPNNFPWWYNCHECGKPQYSSGIILPCFYEHLCSDCSDVDNLMGLEMRQLEYDFS